jgi:hypothetical protein
MLLLTSNWEREAIVVLFVRQDSGENQTWFDREKISLFVVCLLAFDAVEDAKTSIQLPKAYMVLSKYILASISL